MIVSLFLQQLHYPSLKPLVPLFVTSLPMIQAGCWPVIFNESGRARARNAH